MSGPPVLERTIRTIAAVAVLLSPSLRIAIDAGEVGGPAHVEASHDADRCRVLHDHQACLQLYASSMTPVEPTATLPESPGPRQAGATPDRRHGSPDATGPALPRAPPTLLV